MTRCWRRCGFELVIASAVLVGGAIAYKGDCAFAQIAPDDTLGTERSVVTPTNNNGIPTNQIDGGATRGANLFHSFEQFSIPTGGAAYFNNALDVQNIFSRVTGKSISNIDGLIQANGTANLFLLNPNGIIFGPNASLNIGGSFVGSTASAVNFADGTQFSATAPQATPLLTVSVPLGLQYGSNAGSVQVQESILQMQPGQTLALMGGNVSVEGGEFGFLEALGGRIELGGLAGAGILDIEGQESLGAFRLTSLHFPDAVERADVLLSNYAYVDVATGGSGSVAINARNLKVLGGVAGESVLRAGIASGLGSPEATAGDITLNATGAITVAGSNIFNLVRPSSVGNGGSINITTGSLSVTNGAQVSASTFGQGNAGSVTINARDTVSFDGQSSDGNLSLASSTVASEAVGKGSSVKITTGSLYGTNGAQVLASTRGQGDAGSVTSNARDTVSFDFDGESRDGLFFSGAYSTVESEAVGNGGGINITAGSFYVTNGAQLTASTAGQGNAGSVTIDARDTVSFDGESAAFSTVESEAAVGNGGSINITTGSLYVTNGAQVLALTRGQGNAGSVMIDARDTVSFDGQSSDGFSSKASSTVESQAVGKGGSVNIRTGSLSVTNGAQVRASTRGQGDAGSVTINARDTVSFDGESRDGLASSGAYSTVESQAVGNGGGINITAESLSVTDAARLSTSSEGSGVAGSIKVAASSIRLENLALFSADTPAGQGNIFLRSGDLVLRRGSNITTDATGTATGGNITIDTDVLVALENSDITANASEGRGGRVIIDASGIFGTEFRTQRTPQSDITATSNLGPQFSGSVEINTPDVDPNRGLINLPAELVDASKLIASSCGAGGKNEFIITGRGGLPPNPSDSLSSDTVWSDLRYHPQLALTPPISEEATNPTRERAPTQIVETSGWVINNKGEVMLTANAPNVTPRSPWIPSANCHTPQASS